jgi:hypothetical protein
MACDLCAAPSQVLQVRGADTRRHDPYKFPYTLRLVEYGDSIHGDHDKVEKHDVLDRFRAAVGFFSGVAVVAVATLNLIRQLIELGVVDLPGTAFTDDVVVTQREIRVEVVQAYHTDVGADMTEVVRALLEQTGEALPPNVRPVQELLDDVRKRRAEDDESDQDREDD